MAFVTRVTLAGLLFAIGTQAAATQTSDAQADAAITLAEMNPACADPILFTRPASYRSGLRESFLMQPELANVERRSPGFADEATDLTVQVIRATLTERRSATCAMLASAFRRHVSPSGLQAYGAFFQSPIGQIYLANFRTVLARRLAVVDPEDRLTMGESLYNGDVATVAGQMQNIFQQSQVEARGMLTPEQTEQYRAAVANPEIIIANATGMPAADAEIRASSQVELGRIVQRALEVATPQLRAIAARRLARAGR